MERSGNSSVKELLKDRSFQYRFAGLWLHYGPERAAEIVGCTLDEVEECFIEEPGLESEFAQALAERAAVRMQRYGAPRKERLLALLADVAEDEAEDVGKRVRAADAFLRSLDKTAPDKPKSIDDVAEKYGEIWKQLGLKV